ncbi:MAG: peptidylprolyl isomerase [Candidatus Brocadiaceae bacterium]|nr:peptidylprolyl isomerase [Candidatus Brocadiaceae bacterium]
MIGRNIISIFSAGVFALFLYGCGKSELSSLQPGNQETEQDFAEIHKNVDFEQKDKEKLHGSSVPTESNAYKVHGSTVHGSKEKVDPDTVIASVNGEKILRKDLDQILDRFRKQVDPKSIPALEQQITDQLLTQALLRQFVTEKELTVSDEVVTTEINKMRDNIKTNPATKDKSLEQFLALQGSNINELKTAIKMSAALENYVARNVDDKKLEEYFIKNISEYNGETVTASHILVDTKEINDQEELNKARAKIESIKKEIDEGADFAEMAKKYSDCPTAGNGGELGSFPRHGVMVEAFSSAAFALDVGKVSDPVKTEFGYHLIHVSEHTPSRDVSFSEVKDQVKEKLVATEMRNLIKELKETAEIEVTLQ